MVPPDSDAELLLPAFWAKAFWRAVFASFELPGEPLGDDSSLPLSSELTEGRRWRTILLLSSFGLKPAELACRLAVADVVVGVIWSDWWARVWAAVAAAVCCDWLMSVPFTYCIVPWAMRCFWTGVVEGTAGTAGSGRENRTFRFVFGGLMQPAYTAYHSGAV